MHLRQGEACKDKMCDGKTPRSVSQRGAAKISLQKRTFQQNHFSLFIRGLRGFFSGLGIRSFAHRSFAHLLIAHSFIRSFTHFAQIK